MTLDYQKFLDDIKTVYDKHAVVQKERFENGDAFNVFNILGLQTKEVRTHSAFIADLLDPHGSHGQKDKFLKLFLSEMNIPENLDTKNAKVTKEKSIGRIDWQKLTGGQIDIVVEFRNPKFAIIIENKIDATDQSAQLIRYKNFAEKDYPDTHIILYLTLDGHEPSEYSTHCKAKSLDKYWQCISYGNEIKNWLCKCENASCDTFTVKSTIYQYKNLISHITGEETEMEKELKKLMEENVEAILDIEENLSVFDGMIWEKFIFQMRELATELDCTMPDETSFDLWNNDNTMIFIPNKNLDFKICFEKASRDSSFYYVENKNINLKQKKLHCFDYEPDRNYKYGWSYFKDDWQKWNVNTKRAIHSGEMKSYIKTCLENIIKELN